MFLFLVNIYEIVVLFSFFWPPNDDYYRLVLCGLFVFGFFFVFCFCFFVIILILKESEKCLA